MLYLEPPFHMIEGVSLFRDHADRLQWYYLPLGPRLTVTRDPGAGNAAVPQLQVIKFRGSAGSGGFLNFDVDLGIDPDLLEDVARQLKSRESLPDRPRLAPVPLVDGTVRLLLFDLVDTPPPASGPGGAPAPPPRGDAAPPGPEKFVLKAEHAAKPALYGDNRAAFSVQLSQAGVTILEKALQGEMSPIGVVYSLDFLALRPAYHVRVHADWDRVQKHFEEHFKTRIPLIYQSDVDKIVDKLIEEQVITIEVDTFVPEGEDASGVLGRRDQAVQEVQDMVTETFFKPSIEPMPRQDGTSSGLETAGRVIRMIGSGGMSEAKLFSYSKSDVTRIDKKRLDVNMRERTTVKRTIYPQGHLAGLFRLLRDGGVDLQRFILSVDTDDPWFQKRKVHLISRADFAADSITSLNVTVEYAGEPKNAILDATLPNEDLEWGSRVENGTMRREAKLRYTVNFKDADGTERPIALQSPEQVVTADNVEIVPRELYTIIQVPILALNFPWDRYSHVEIKTRYEDAANGIKQGDVFLLDKDHPEATLKLFVRDPAKTTFAYRTIYRGVNHKDLERPFVETDEERIVLRDPFPTARELTIVPAFDWTKVDRAFVDVSYRDDENGVLQEQSFEFNETVKATQTFRVALQNPRKRIVNFRVTVIGKNGDLTEIPTSSTLERRITVRGDMKGHRIVTLTAENADFAGAQIREITVQARYVDQPNGLAFADTFVLRAPGDVATFEYDYVNGGPEGYEIQVSRRFTNGLSRDTQWMPGNDNELLIRLAG